jgi:beta-aspartyl-dipeptidase (metallo-type)
VAYKNFHRLHLFCLPEAEYSSNRQKGCGSMFTLIKNAEIYTPDQAGTNDVLIAGSKIAAIGPSISIPKGLFDLHEIDGSEKIMTPGFIDQHVHIAGGGGEGGPVSRTPEITLSKLTQAGVTTVIGLLGVDGITRSVAELLTKARALEEEGITAYIYTGAYEIPTRTLTGNVRSDLVLIDKVIGTGEIAISDHRSAQPTMEMLIKLASEARVGGLLGKKPGIIHLHLGDGKQGLSLLFEVVKNSDIPITQFVPTHVNRLDRLFGEAIEFLKLGGNIDLTAGITKENESPHALEVYEALKLLVAAKANLYKVTVSSDANGSMPQFAKDGRLVGIGVGSAAELWKNITKAVRKNVIPLPTALALITRNVADLLKLSPAKGIIAVDSDADIVLLNKDLSIDTVIAKGKLMVQNGQAIVKGYFEGRG